MNFKQAGDAWFLNSPEESMGFVLADQGFDVWVGNVRGTRWSHGHVSLSEDDKVYIAYTFFCLAVIMSFISFNDKMWFQ